MFTEPQSESYYYYYKMSHFLPSSNVVSQVSLVVFIREGVYNSNKHFIMDNIMQYKS